jgi:hypothetical protein
MIYRKKFKRTYWFDGEILKWILYLEKKWLREGERRERQKERERKGRQKASKRETSEIRN